MNGAEPQQSRILAEQSKGHPVEVRGDIPSNKQSGAQRAMDWQLRRWLDIVTLILAVLGIGFAIYQAWDSSHLREDTRNLLGYATTKFVAEFPDNIPEITTLVGETCGKLEILADLTGYGIYSDPRHFDEYEEAILRARASRIGENFSQKRCADAIRPPTNDGKPEVDLLVFNPLDQDKKTMRKEFSDEWRRQLASSGDGQSKFLNFVENNRGILRNGESGVTFAQKVAADNEAYEHFISFIEEKNKRIERDLSDKGVKVRYSRQALVYMRIWNQDSKGAVFSFDNTPAAGYETEISFISHDAHLLGTFDTMFKKYWEDAICDSEFEQYVKGNPSPNADDLMDHRKLPNCTN